MLVNSKDQVMGDLAVVENNQRLARQAQEAFKEVMKHMMNTSPESGNIRREALAKRVENYEIRSNFGSGW